MGNKTDTGDVVRELNAIESEALERFKKQDEEIVGFVFLNAN